jgi:hypothetical protein
MTGRAQMINVADMVNPQTGQTWREENLARTHGIPVGALVEIVSDPEYPDDERENDGLRLLVAHRGRDCDETPLYWLTAQPETVGLTWEELGPWRRWYGGHAEEGLKVIRLPRDER